MDIPVTLVIKAPNQKYDDQTINCFSNWTVERLKTHLSDVYPSKPSSKDQRLVYSGKLLTDNLQLKDVLRKHDEYHMFHLVCASHTPPGSPQAPTPRHRGHSKGQACPDPRPASRELSSNASSPSTGTCHTSGQTPSLHNTSGPIISNTTHPAYTQGYPWPQPSNPWTWTGASPQLSSTQTTALPICPRSLIWWQQLYAWQLYTHYRASLAAYHPSTTSSPTDSQSEQPREVHEAALVEPIAGEGQDEEDPNRDWPDWVYTGYRAAVLLGIVYFYSSFSRFVMVMGGMLLLYLHQAGRLPFNLENELLNFADGGNFDDLDGDLNDFQDLERVMDDGLGDEDGDSGEEGSEGLDGDDQSGFLSSIWSFITTFFTSLIPEGMPNAAN